MLQNLQTMLEFTKGLTGITNFAVYYGILGLIVYVCIIHRALRKIRYDSKHGFEQ